MPTKIDWTDETWNPVTGCTKIAEGCRNCYAERMTRRFWKQWGCEPPPNHFKVKLHPDRLDQPRKWKKPRRVFVCSMSDLFHEQVPFEFIDRVFATMAMCPQHTFQILTKRFVRAVEYFEYAKLDPITDHITVLFSIATQEELWVAEGWLWQIPAAVRGFSLEPLLGPIQELPPFEWYIIGCESGPKRRPCDVEWIRDIVRQCKDANVKIFVKQLEINGKVSHDPATWPEDLRGIREYPRIEP